jgi:site-specific recombinase XerD
MHTESDLRIYLVWCAERHLEPLTVRRAHVEMYVRWLQKVRRFRPSTVSRRLSVVVGFHRICVIDGILEHSPADHVRRPKVPPESPTLGLSHLQFQALLSAARASANPTPSPWSRCSDCSDSESSSPSAPTPTTWARNTATESYAWSARTPGSC